MQRKVTPPHPAASRSVPTQTKVETRPSSARVHPRSQHRQSLLGISIGRSLKIVVSFRDYIRNIKAGEPDELADETPRQTFPHCFDVPAVHQTTHSVRFRLPSIT